MLGIISDKNILTPTDSRLSNSIKDYCPQSIDDYILHLNYFNQIVPNSALGWASDSNGFISHFKGKYSGKGCFPGENSSSLTPFDLSGLKTLEYFPYALKDFKRRGVDDSSLEKSVESFLKLWEQVLKN